MIWKFTFIYTGKVFCKHKSKFLRPFSTRSTNNKQFHLFSYGTWHRNSDHAECQLFQHLMRPKH